jgi:hypothetical protein
VELTLGIYSNLISCKKLKITLAQTSILVYTDFGFKKVAIFVALFRCDGMADIVDLKSYASPSVAIPQTRLAQGFMLFC